MIRVFYAFGKSLLCISSDLSLFTQASESFAVADFSCPQCGRKHDCSFISPYSRDMISFESGRAICRTIQVKQVQCKSCGSIHAILPDCLVPNTSYSLSFILSALRAYFFQRVSVQVLCERFSIAVSTLYAWIKLFHLHKRLWLGVLKDSEVSATVFVDHLLPSDFSPLCFFRSFGFSFMQHAFTTPCNSS